MFFVGIDGKGKKLLGIGHQSDPVGSSWCLPQFHMYKTEMPYISGFVMQSSNTGKILKHVSLYITVMLFIGMEENKSKISLLHNYFYVLYNKAMSACLLTSYSFHAAFKWLPYSLYI